jgi:hypothetical protein
MMIDGENEITGRSRPHPANLVHSLRPVSDHAPIHCFCFAVGIADQARSTTPTTRVASSVTRRVRRRVGLLCAGHDLVQQDGDIPYTHDELVAAAPISTGSCACSPTARAPCSRPETRRPTARGHVAVGYDK